MAEDLAIQLILGLGGLLVLVGAPAAILAVAAVAGTRKPGEGPKSTGGRGVMIALVGHAIGVATLLCALAGVLGCFIFLDGAHGGAEEIGAYAMIPLTIGGLLQGPALFGVGLAIARGGGQKTRIAVLAMAAWVAFHNVFASATLVLLLANDLDLVGVLCCSIPAAIGCVHAFAMAWVGLMRIGTDAAPAPVAA